jgi:HAD superfamily hydrolase (TIGR01509 family)
MLQAIIFDMDGVLVDNHEPWTAFDKKFLAQFNITPSKEHSLYVNGRSEEEVVSWIKENYKLTESVDEIWASRQGWLRDVYEVGSKPMSEVENLLKKIKESNLKLALCSGAKMWMIKIILDRFQWHDYFEVVVSADHVGYLGKPNPEIYLHTARLLNVPPANCLVFEDAENGVKAAIDAGMSCVGYKDSRFDLPADLSAANFVVNSFADKKLIKFLGV